MNRTRLAKIALLGVVFATAASAGSEVKTELGAAGPAAPLRGTLLRAGRRRRSGRAHHPRLGADRSRWRVDVTGMHPGLLPLFAPQVRGFLIDAFAYDPARLIAAVSTPVLIVQGERDLQVGVEDAERLRAAAPNAELVLLPDANHVLKAVSSDDRRENARTYGDPSTPLAPGVADRRRDPRFIAAPPKVQERPRDDRRRPAARWPSYAAARLSNSPRPSTPPTIGSIRFSGCGIRPSTRKPSP
jgi:hypothetical protein